MHSTVNQSFFALFPDGPVSSSHNFKPFEKGDCPPRTRQENRCKTLRPSLNKKQPLIYNKHLQIREADPKITSGKHKVGSMSMDYQEVKSKVMAIQIDSFREKPANAKVKVNLQDKVRNELLLKKDQVILRTMNSALRTDEKAITDTRPEYNASFNRLAERLRKSKYTAKLSSSNKVSEYTKGVVQDKTQALIKNLNITQSRWRKKHGLFEGVEADIAKQIFNILDLNKAGEISAEHLLEFLIEIGIPLDQSILKATMCQILRVSELKGTFLTREKLAQFCRADKKSQIFLEKFRELLGTDYKPVDMINLIKFWWKDLGRDTVNITEVCDYLEKIGMFKDFLEAKNYLSKALNDSFLAYNQFLSIFANAVVSLTMSYVSRLLNEDDPYSPHQSKVFKINRLKKHLIFAGMNYPQENISFEEGRKTIAAREKLEKLKKKDNENQEEFKYIWFKLTGCILESSPVTPITTPDIKQPQQLATFHPKDVPGYSVRQQSALPTPSPVQLRGTLYPSPSHWDAIQPSLYGIKRKSKLLQSKDLLSLSDYQNLINKLSPN